MVAYFHILGHLTVHMSIDVHLLKLPFTHKFQFGNIVPAAGILHYPLVLTAF